MSVPDPVDVYVYIICCHDWAFSQLLEIDICHLLLSTLPSPRRSETFETSALTYEQCVLHCLSDPEHDVSSSIWIIAIYSEKTNGDEISYFTFCKRYGVSHTLVRPLPE